MKLLTPYEIMCLDDQNCPYCEQPVDYDDGYYYCFICHKKWHYGYVKDCIRDYENNPQEYINKLKQNK